MIIFLSTKYQTQFYNIVSFLCETYDAKITVYSNGRNIETEQINYNDKLKFIIPIHGIETTHDAITRVPNSFKETINTLFAFEKVKQKYAIKFIFNEEMIRTNFNIYGFLNENMFNPEEIIFARLNFTDKGQKNNVVIPKSEALREYVEKQFKVLSSFFKIKFIDIPFCYIKNSKVDVAEEKKPSFFFNDSNKIMLETNYYKDMLINSSCVKCEWYKLCKIMSSSYLTLTYNDDIWQIEKE